MAAFTRQNRQSVIATRGSDGKCSGEPVRNRLWQERGRVWKDLDWAAWVKPELAWRGIRNSLEGERMVLALAPGRRSSQQLLF